MRGDAVFGDLLHFAGADLQLDALLARPDHRGVDGAVIVLLGRRNVVLEASRNDRPRRVHDAERLIAFADIADDDAEAENIGQLLEADRLAFHLAPDRIGTLAAAGDFGGDAAVGELSSELFFNLGDPAARFGGKRLEPLGQHLIGLGIELAKRQVLELLAHLLHAHAAGERRVDFERLVGSAPARRRRLIFERAHVVQAVGELDQQHAHVVGNGKQQLAQVLGLLGLLGDQIEPLQFGQAFDQKPDLVAEQPVDLGAGGVGVLDRVVQQRRRDGGVVELQPGEDGRYFERMGNIGVARGAFLLAMRPHGIDIGAIEQVLIGGGIVLLDVLDQIVLPHARLARLGPRHLGGVRRDQARRTRQRSPRAGLILHARQIDRRTRHSNPEVVVIPKSCHSTALGRPGKTPDSATTAHKDIMQVRGRHKPRGT